MKPFRDVYELTELVQAGETAYLIEEGAWYEGEEGLRVATWRR